MENETSSQPASEPLDPGLVELAARLAGDIADLQAIVAPLTQSHADWRPGPDRWSAGEVLHHLVLSNRAFAAAVRSLVARGRRGGVTAVPGARSSWPRMRSIADPRAAGPVKNPARVTPTAGVPIDRLRADLAAAHARVASQIPDLAGLDLAALTAPHPLGFELNLYQWVDLAGAHERRHLVQIRDILAAPGFPPL